MARIIKFPLKMKNGAEVRSLDELKENFDLESVLTYYVSGQLIAWLKNYNYDKTTADTITKVEALDKNAPDISKQLCEVLGVEYVESEDVDLDEAKEKLEREKILKQLLTEEQMKFVATNDDELAELIENGAKKVYLAFGSFYITNDSIEYEVIKQTNPTIDGFYSVNEGNFDRAKKFADNGIAAAQYRVSLYYDEIDDNVNSQKYIKLAADQDYINALEWISKNDCDTFDELYLNRIISKAEKGNIQYQMLLGNHYRRNRKVDEAVHWLNIVAQSNDLTGKRAKKMFENYDYYFVGDGVNETPIVLGGVIGGIINVLRKFFIDSGNLDDTEENDLK